MTIVFRYLKAYRLRAITGILIKTAATVSELFLPLILSHILYDVISRTVFDIVFWSGMMLLCSIAAWGLNILANRIAAKVSKDLSDDLRKDLFLAALRLSAAQTDAFTVPSLEARITTDTYNVHQFVNMIQRLGVRSPIMLLGGIGITLVMDAKLALVMLALIPLIGGVITLIRFCGIPLYQRVQEATDRMITVVREDVQGMRVIRALSKTGYERDRYARANRALVREEIRAGVVMSSINPLMGAFMNLGCIAVLALGGHFVSRGTSDAETIIAFMQYFTLISNAMMSVTRFFVMYSKSAASAARIGEVLSAVSPLTVKDVSEYPGKETDAHILFDHVSFSYNGRKNNADDLSFSVSRGEHLGIIGATGSGKSTLLCLLLRFYDADSGAVLIGGRDVRTMEKERLCSMFGTALQKDFLYADTVYENIRFGRDIPDGDIRAAARIAQAEEFITAFPEGYSHPLSPRGSNLSGGQRQRLLIARAIAGNPEILVLDDSFSALDYKTDAAVRAGLAQSLSGTTVLTVAQRISSVRNCDRILVLDGGRIIGSGTHDALLASCPVYREICDSQTGGAFVD